jgi:uroporphyrinogen-III synthase
VSGRLFILRPEPAASKTAGKAQRLGFSTVVHPLFAVEPLPWRAPDPAAFDALMLTSANAVRHGGRELARYRDLPTFTVGKATADAARAAGFVDVHGGDGDVATLIRALEMTTHRRILHLSGRDVTDSDPGGLRIERIAVYRSIARDDATALAGLLAPGDNLLIHSPRAGALLADILSETQRESLGIAAISAAALATCGGGWRDARAADAPNATALLALAAHMWL